MSIDRRRVLTRFLATTSALALAPAASSWLTGTRFAAPAAAQSMEALMEPGPEPDMVMGDANAPVTIIEYASMTCPHCAHFHDTTLPGLKEKYIDTGKAKLILREFPFDPRALAAFMLARCAPENQYYPLIDVLFKQQRTWATAEDPRPPLLQIAKLAGFTQESFEACLKNQQVLDNVMAVKEKAEKDFGVDSTPTFFINGEKHSGALSLEEMSTIIDKYL
jgi:protein-disulfide isomerase